VFFATGQLIGPAAAGWLINATQSFRLTFAVSALMMFVGVLLTIRLARLPAPASVDAQ